MTKDEIVGWHHCLNGHEFEKTVGDSVGQGSLACCGPWGCKKLDMTQQLNSNNLFYIHSAQQGRKMSHVTFVESELHRNLETFPRLYQQKIVETVQNLLLPSIIQAIFNLLTLTEYRIREKKNLNNLLKSFLLIILGLYTMNKMDG